MSRPFQRIVIIVLALLLVVPIGVLGIGQLRGPQEDPAAQPSSERPTMDPEDQPARPDLPRPEEPAVVTEQSAEGAEATLAYLLESYPYMMSTGDTSVWEGGIDPNCQVCLSFLDNARQLSDQGGYLTGGEFTVHSTTFEGVGEPPATGTVVADFTQEQSILVDDPELSPGVLEEASGQFIASVVWDGQRWRVADLGLVPQGGAVSDGGGADATPGG